MNEFERLLLEQGSQRMISVFSEIYHDQLSEDFKNYASMPCKKIEDMEIRAFLDAYGESFPKGVAMRIWNACRDNDIKTVDDLLKKGAGEFLKFRNVGKDSISSLREIFAKLDLKFSDTPTVQCEKMEDVKIVDFLEIYGSSFPKGIAIRIYNACRYNNIKTIGDLLKTGTQEFLRLRNIGNDTVKCLQEILAKHGLEFK